jgi:predicted aspartyl protease
MLIHGKWLLCDDEALRPIFEGEVLAGDGSWAKVEFLVDTGADRTVFAAHVLRSLQLPQSANVEALGGVGGVTDSVRVETQIRFVAEEIGKITIRGQFAAFTDLAALDMSVLGRDILNLFAVIVDRPRDVVCLIGQGHQYTITPSRA